ncbi:hypothetical protein ACFC3O_28810 [Streptomyces sp. NPDC056007]|uniref:hypothetical protein n=1 Tax=Streptomyces sp. NPDC056007 TaxID=3345678 RepID=UPI0035E2FA3F
MTTQQAGLVPVEQIEGETRAVDLVVAYVVGDVDLVVAARLQGGELARGYMLQQLDGMLSVSGRVRGIGWVASFTSSGSVCSAVWEAVGDPLAR